MAVAAWVTSVSASDLCLSVLTLGEIRNGVERLRPRDPDQAAVFETWLADLRRRFGDRILPVDERVADEWGRLNAAAPRKTVDSMIAATAHVHALTVVTGNSRDFAGCGVRVLDPWQYE
jgi:toxin FitB